MLHSIGQLFSSASDAAAADEFGNQVDRVAVGVDAAGGFDDEGNLDLSNLLRVVHLFPPFVSERQEKSVSLNEIPLRN